MIRPSTSDPGRRHPPWTSRGERRAWNSDSSVCTTGGAPRRAAPPAGQRAEHRQPPIPGPFPGTTARPSGRRVGGRAGGGVRRLGLHLRRLRANGPRVHGTDRHPLAAELGEEEGEPVEDLVLLQLARRGPVARVAVDRQEHGPRRRRRRLPRRGDLARVERLHAAVVETGGHEARGVRRAGPDVVDGRVGPDPAVLGLDVGVAVLLRPDLRELEAVEAQHVGERHRAEDRLAEVGPLVGDDGDEQAAVAPARDREPVTRGLAGGDEPVGAGDEVVVDVLLPARGSPPRARPRRTRRRRAGTR